MQQKISSEHPSRRAALKSGMVGAATLLPAGLASHEVLTNVQDDIKTDKECIMAAGLTEAEADCWEKIAAAAGAFFQLPQLHPEDNKEVAVAIHVVQNKLLGRPTYRKYLEVAKANQKRKQKQKRQENQQQT